MSNFLLCNFKESKKFDVHSEDIIEEWNIEENLLIEGEVAKNVQYSTGNFDNAPRNSLNKQRNPRKKFNTTSALYPYLPLSNFKPHDYRIRRYLVPQND